MDTKCFNVLASCRVAAPSGENTNLPQYEESLFYLVACPIETQDIQCKPYHLNRSCTLFATQNVSPCSILPYRSCIGGNPCKSNRTCRTIHISFATRSVFRARRFPLTRFRTPAKRRTLSIVWVLISPDAWRCRIGENLYRDNSLVAILCPEIDIFLRSPVATSSCTIFKRHPIGSVVQRITHTSCLSMNSFHASSGMRHRFVCSCGLKETALSFPELIKL